VAQSPDLGQVIALIEIGPKPVVAMIHWVAMRGSFELALFCHARVATRSAVLALPEVKLGLMPRSHGTQRLPCLVSLARAIDMTRGGKTQNAEIWRSTVLLDQIVDDEQAILDVAVTPAQEIARTGRWQPTRVLVAPKVEADTLLDAARAKAARSAPHVMARHRCFDAWETSVKLPFVDGLIQEWSYFLELSATAPARVLRHLLVRERSASSIVDLPKGTQGRTIHTSAVMGTGIAQCLTSMGIPVSLMNRDQASFDRGVAEITAQLARGKGRAEAQQMGTALGLLTPVADYRALDEADIVIKVVFERMDVKMKVFRSLDAAIKPGVILETNTSMLDINRLVASIGRPQDVEGMRFFSPAHTMRLLEVVRGEYTSLEVLVPASRVTTRFIARGCLARVASYVALTFSEASAKCSLKTCAPSFI